MTVEIELKYQLSANNDGNDAVADDISAMLSAQNISFEIKSHQLTNDYYDTDNLALRAMDFGLRIRTVAGRYEQTIKTAGKVEGCLHQRPEYNVDIADNSLKLALFPKSIWPQNTNVEALEKQLQVIFSTNFFRQTWLIHQDDSIIELALDRGEITTSAKAPKLAINELEIELVNGNKEALFILAEQLGTIVQMTPGKLSKAARGYSLYHAR